jgi:GT2 family glycosyltransferase
MDVSGETGFQQKRDSVIIVTYNHEKYIEQCLDSALNNNPYEIIVVDNCSTDRTVALVSSYPNVRLIKSDTNAGFGSANNLGASYASGDNLVFLNPDTIVEENWLKNLTEPINDDRTVSIPLILLYDDDKVNTIGNIEHISGLSFVNGLGKRRDAEDACSPNGVSGACFAMSKKGYLDLGGFDQTFFCYMEDTELSWRMMLNGYNIVLQPDAIVHHDYRMRLTPEKLFMVESGRYVIIRKYVPMAAIIASFPMFLISEAIIWSYCFLNGKKFVRSKFNATIKGLTMAVEKNKREFCDISSKLDWSIPETPLAPSKVYQKLLKVANVLMSLNKSLVS